MLPPFGVFAETKGGNNPYFLTGAGGVIQSMVYGFGGLDITEKGLRKISTVIPKEWTSVTIKTKAKVQAQNLETPSNNPNRIKSNIFESAKR